MSGIDGCTRETGDDRKYGQQLVFKVKQLNEEISTVACFFLTDHVKYQEKMCSEREDKRDMLNNPILSKIQCLVSNLKDEIDLSCKKPEGEYSKQEKE